MILATATATATSNKQQATATSNKQQQVGFNYHISGTPIAQGPKLRANDPLPKALIPTKFGPPTPGGGGGREALGQGRGVQSAPRQKAHDKQLGPIAKSLDRGRGHRAALAVWFTTLVRGPQWTIHFGKQQQQQQQQATSNKQQVGFN